MSIARIAEKIENPSVTQLLAAYPDKEKFDEAVRAGRIKPTTEAGVAANIFNRIVAAALAKQARIQGEKTVFQELTAPQRMGLGAIAPGMGQGMGQPQPQGIDQIPVPDQMFEPQGMAGGGVVAFQGGGFNPAQRGSIGQIFAPTAGTISREEVIRSLTLPELQEFNRSGKLPERLRDVIGGQVIGPPVMTQPSFIGALSGQQAVQPSVEDIIAQAQRGEGPNVSRPAAPADIAVVPPGGPVIPRPTAIAESAPARSVVKKPEGEKKPSSIFDEATNAANKLKAYKTQFEITDTDPDAALRAKLSELQKGSKDERREAAYMAMIMAGLGIAGGTSPYFAVNLKEAIPALKEFGVAKRDIKKAEMEYTKMEADLNRAADARKRGDMELALRLQESAADRELRLRQVIAAEKAANKPSQLRELIELAAGGDKSKVQPLAQAALSGKTGPKPMSQYERATLQQNALKNATAELKNNREYGRLANSKDPADRAKAQKIRNDVIAQYMDVERSGLGGSNSALFDEADAILGLK